LPRAAAAAESVLTEREGLVRPGAKRVPEKPLAAGITEIKPQRAGAVVKERGKILFLHPLEQVVHVFQVIVTCSGVVPATEFVRLTLNRREHRDFDDMPQANMGIDRPLTEITGIMQHLSPPGLGGGERSVAIAGAGESTATGEQRSSEFDGILQERQVFLDGEISGSSRGQQPAAAT